MNFGGYLVYRAWRLISCFSGLFPSWEKAGLALAQGHVPPRNESERRRSICGKRVNEEATVGRDGVLPVCDALGGNACLKEDMWRAGGACVRVKTHCGQLSVGLNEKYLPAVMAPTGLRSGPGRNLDAPAMSRKTFDENYVPRSRVHGPFPIRGKLGLDALSGE